jgi:D-glycero-alpha-D-manno-heptose 1-phosphate guanylyltransferase
MNIEAIVLAGGFGTRLRTVISDVPKPMAPIDGVPFLTYLLKQIIRNNVTRIILAVGYKAGAIKTSYGSSFDGVPLTYCEEEAPLGTGGAIRKSLTRCLEKNVIVMNGDTFFEVDLPELLSFHVRKSADVTIALKEMHNFDRYGAVECTASTVTSLREKRYVADGYINGGVYSLRRDVFECFSLPKRFSFEDFIAEQVNDLKVCALPSGGNFIDVGVPEDYLAAQSLLPKWVAHKSLI